MHAAPQIEPGKSVVDKSRQPNGVISAVNKGAIEISSPATHVVDRTTRLIKVCAQANIVLGPLQGVRVEVENDTDRPVLFDGDMATANAGSVQLHAAGTADVEDAVCPTKTKAQRFVHDVKASTVAALTVGTLPAVHDAAIQSGPLPERYGADDARRVEELSRFGKRVLWPGDTTSGVLYFKVDQPIGQCEIEMPVSSSFGSGE